MPLMILGALVFASVASFMYISNHKEQFIRRNAPSKSTSNVIFLPDDLDAHRKSREKGKDKEE